MQAPWLVIILASDTVVAQCYFQGLLMLDIHGFIPVYHIETVEVNSPILFAKAASSVFM